MKIELKAQKRDVFGKKTEDLRQKGLIPAELYGHDTENLHLAVSSRDLKKTLKEAGENTIVTITLDDKEYPVLIHDYQSNPINGEFRSVDFYKVRMDEKIEAAVPLEFIGVSPAVKDLHGILIKAMDEIEVEALPIDLPRSLEVDISNLTELGQSLFVKDIPVKGKFEIKVDPDTVVATVTEPKEEEEVAPVDIESVAVETEEKKAEREAKKAEETEK